MIELIDNFQFVEVNTMKKYWEIPLVVCVFALVAGASFHGLRMHPENANAYDLGVTMGIIMASIAAISFVAFLIVLIQQDTRKVCNHWWQKTFKNA